MLPKQTAPIYTLTLPSTKKPVKYRPFLVKERNALMLANESEDPVVMIDTLKEVIKNCFKSEVDVDKLAIFDLEYIFIKMRTKSIDDISRIKLLCSKCDDENAFVELAIDLDKIEVMFPEGHTNKIHLFDNVGIVMRYPSLDVIKKLDNLDDVNILMEVLIECTDYIYDGDEIHYASETTREELVEFFNDLTDVQLKSVAQFFATQPKLTQDVNYECPVCGTKHTRSIEGLESFF